MFNANNAANAAAACEKNVQEFNDLARNHATDAKIFLEMLPLVPLQHRIQQMQLLKARQM